MKLTPILRGNREKSKNLKLRYAHRQTMVYINTDIEINPDHFDATGGKSGDKFVKSTAADHVTTNILIQKKIADVKSCCDKYFMDHGNYPLATYINQCFSKQGSNATAQTPTLSTLFAMFLRELITKNISADRIAHYNVTLRHIERYIQHTGTTPFTGNWENINLNFFYAFKEFLRTAPSQVEASPKSRTEGREGMGDNTIDSNITRLKTFLYWASDNKHIPLDRATIKQFETKWKPRDIFFHDDEELRKLFNVDLSHSQYLEKVRDAYIIQCTTGLRHSDTDSRLWSLEGEYLKTMPHKTAISTGKDVTIHLRPEAAAIIQKYIGSNLRFPKFENAPYNVAIKQIGHLAGITQTVTIVKGRKKFRPGKQLPKYQLMSSHVARATFICTQLRYKSSLSDIMAMTGITLDTLKFYSVVVNESIKEASETVYAKQGDLRVTHINKDVKFA